MAGKRCNRAPQFTRKRSRPVNVSDRFQQKCTRPIVPAPELCWINLFSVWTLLLLLIVGSSICCALGGKQIHWCWIKWPIKGSLIKLQACCFDTIGDAAANRLKSPQRMHIAFEMSADFFPSALTCELKASEDGRRGLAEPYGQGFIDLWNLRSINHSKQPTSLRQLIQQRHN